MNTTHMDNEELILLQDEINGNIQKIERLNEDLLDILGEELYEKMNLDLVLHSLTRELELKLQETYVQIRRNDAADEIEKDPLIAEIETEGVLQ